MASLRSVGRSRGYLSAVLVAANLGEDELRLSEANPA